jgi:uncharacterized protein (TIGR03118 family)
MSSRSRILVVLLCTLVAAAWGVPATAQQPRGYVQRNLVVNRYDPADRHSPPRAPIVDPDLRNPWGAAIRSAGLGGHFWLANQASDTVTEYVGDVFDAEGKFVPLYQDALKVVPVDGAPIGQVFSSSDTDFPVSGPFCTDDNASKCDPSEPSYLGYFTGPARFITNTEDGKIAAWTEGTFNGKFGRMRAFDTVLDHSPYSALYRGLTITERASGNRLYAANFASGEIEVYNNRWERVRPAGDDTFRKPSGVPSIYRPFNVQYLENYVYVTYARLVRRGERDFEPDEPFAERACKGCGYLAVFDEDGRHVATWEGRNRLNAPWGMTIAPANFGEFSNALLVGNFGDGTIVGFDRNTGRQIGYLRKPNGRIIKIDGLWAIFFGNGASLGRSDYLYFTAGPNDEEDGIFGSLSWVGVPNPSPTP